MKKNILIAAFMSLSALSGCATIVGSPTHVMPISSKPGDATVFITDEKGAEIFKGQTPTSVTLNKSSGSYFGGKNYLVNISKAGFAPQTIPVNSRANGWYIGGNILFGGLIGWLIVDPLNGHMYTLAPEYVDGLQNTSNTKHNNSNSEGGITIALLEDVPAELRDKLKPAN